MLGREEVLRQLAGAQECQAEVRGLATQHRERWLTPRRAAALEAAIFSAGFGFLLGVLFFLL
jgi:hypothetical protein